jgi:hypothetical protein
MAMIELHIRCATCAYDLIGLDDHGQCPDCGASVRSSIAAAAAATGLASSPTGGVDEKVEYERQLRESARQSYRTEKQMDRGDRQMDRYDRVLEHSERLLQAQEANLRRTAALLDGIEALLKKWEQR